MLYPHVHLNTIQILARAAAEWAPPSLRVHPRNVHVKSSRCWCCEVTPRAL